MESRAQAFRTPSWVQAAWLGFVSVSQRGRFQRELVHAPDVRTVELGRAVELLAPVLVVLDDQARHERRVDVPEPVFGHAATRHARQQAQEGDEAPVARDRPDDDPEVRVVPQRFIEFGEEDHHGGEPDGHRQAPPQDEPLGLSLCRLLEGRLLTHEGGESVLSGVDHLTHGRDNRVLDSTCVVVHEPEDDAVVPPFLDHLLDLGDVEVQGEATGQDQSHPVDEVSQRSGDQQDQDDPAQRLGNARERLEQLLVVTVEGIQGASRLSPANPAGGFG